MFSEMLGSYLLLEQLDFFKLQNISDQIRKNDKITLQTFF